VKLKLNQFGGDDVYGKNEVLRVNKIAQKYFENYVTDFVLVHLNVSILKYLTIVNL